MQSEVRKVLETLRENGMVWWSFPADIDAADRADAAKREEPVRKAVAELIDRWSTHYVPIDAAVMVRRLLAELNAVIATKPDSQSATVSEPVCDEKFSFSVECKQCGQSTCTSEEYAAVCGCGAVFKLHRHNQPASEPSVTPTDTKKTRNFGDAIRKKLRENKELAEQVADEHIRAIAEQAVRDAMPDVLDGLAETFGEEGFPSVTNAFREQADKLRKERGA